MTSVDEPLQFVNEKMLTRSIAVALLSDLNDSQNRVACKIHRTKLTVLEKKLDSGHVTKPVSRIVIV